jgi:hypothetical protein
VGQDSGRHLGVLVVTNSRTTIKSYVISDVAIIWLATCLLSVISMDLLGTNADITMATMIAVAFFTLIFAWTRIPVVTESEDGQFVLLSRRLWRGQVKIPRRPGASKYLGQQSILSRFIGRKSNSGTTTYIPAVCLKKVKALMGDAWPGHIKE